MASSNNSNIYLTQLTSLIQNSTLLLHQLTTNNVFDWSSIINADNKSLSTSLDNDNTAGGGKERQEDDDSEEESSDEENMFLGGGYSSSEDDDEPLSSSTNTSNSSNATSSTNAAVVIEDSIEYLNEETSTLLKRAKAVHSALLLSLPHPQSQSTSTKISNEGGKKFVEQLIADILSTNNTSHSPSITSDNSEGYNKLVQTMAYLTSSKIINTNPIKSRISNERWKKICLTNGLLVVQYLIHLLSSESGSSSINDGESVNNGSGESDKESGGPLDEWNVVILPLLFGNSSLFLVDDALRDALLGLSSFSSNTTTSDDTTADDNNNMGKRLDKCRATINICQTTLQNAVSSTTSNKEDRELRQTYILVVCQVLICLNDGIITSSGGISTTGSNKDLLDIVKNGIHSTILTIIRGICYTTTNHNNNTLSSSQQQLTLEALRPVTGMLLPKLYNDATVNKSIGKDTSSSGEEVDVRAVELWNEILKLLEPYSEERKCCKNW